VTADGREVQLKGVNLGGWLLQETWMTPVKGSADHWTTREVLTKRFGAEKAAELFAVYEDHWITGWDLDQIKALGMNVVRVPFGYWNLPSETGDVDFGRLDWIVKECAARGLYVVLDLHGAPGFASNEHSSGKVGASQLFAPGAAGEAFRTKTEELWTEVARHFRGSGTVAAYDLLNEPMAKPSDAELWKLYDRLYRAIRRVDPDHLISVEAIWEVNNLPDPREWGWTQMLYQTHDYGWDQDQARFLEAKMSSSVLVYDYQVPLLVGEFSSFGKFDDWDRTLARYDQAGFQWTMWTWKLTKKGTTPWAVYSSPYVPSPNVAEDSFEDIRQAWSQTDTSGENFARNEYLVTSLTQSLRRKPYPAPLPGPKAQVPLATRYEAEDALIVLSTHAKPGLPMGTEAQGFFSGKLAAGGLNTSLKAGEVEADWSNLPHVKFRVNAEVGGPHRLVLAYNGDDDKTILIRVNGKDIPIHLPPLSGGAWNLMHQKTLVVDLIPGENILQVSGALGGRGWENVDYIELTPLRLAGN